MMRRWLCLCLAALIVLAFHPRKGLAAYVPYEEDTLVGVTDDYSTTNMVDIPVSTADVDTDATLVMLPTNPCAVSFRPGTTEVAVRDTDRIEVYAAGQTLVRIFTLDCPGVISVSYSKDGRFLYACTDRTVYKYAATAAGYALISQGGTSPGLVAVEGGKGHDLWALRKTSLERWLGTSQGTYLQSTVAVLEKGKSVSYSASRNSVVVLDGSVVRYFGMAGTPVELNINVYIGSVNRCPDFRKWSLSGGAYVDENGVLHLPNYGARAVSPYIIQARAKNWCFSADYYSDLPRPGYADMSGYLQGSAYFNINKQASKNDGNYTGNGNAGIYPLGIWTRKYWSYLGGDNVAFIQMNIQANATYTPAHFDVRNPMLTVDGTWATFSGYGIGESAAGEAVAAVQTAGAVRVLTKANGSKYYSVQPGGLVEIPALADDAGGFALAAPSETSQDFAVLALGSGMAGDLDYRGHAELDKHWVRKEARLYVPTDAVALTVYPYLYGCDNHNNTVAETDFDGYRIEGPFDSDPGPITEGNLTPNIGPWSENMEECSGVLWGDPAKSNGQNVLAVGGNWRAAMHYSAATAYCEVRNDGGLYGSNYLRIFDDPTHTWKAFVSSGPALTLQAGKWYRASVYARSSANRGATAYLTYSSEPRLRKYVSWVVGELGPSGSYAGNGARDASGAVDEVGYKREATLYSDTFVATIPITKLRAILDREVSAATSVRLDVSTDGGLTWTELTPDTISDVPEGSALIYKLVLGTTDPLDTPTVDMIQLLQIFVKTLGPGSGATKVRLVP